MSKVTARVTRKPKYIAYQSFLANKVKTLVARSCNMVRNTAIQEIAQGVKSGADRGDGSRASASGEYPATDTGFLISNINVNIKNNGYTGLVESNAQYSSHLEFGTSKMGARPFMQPSLEENRPKIKQLFRNVRK